MADAKTIQRFPAGLLDILGMQSTGDTPHLIGGEVIPTIDLLDYYLIDRLRGQQATTANVAAIGGLVTTVTPPAGEQWLVYGFTGASAALAAATAFTATLAVFRASTGFYQFIGPNVSAANPATYANGVSFSQPFIMRPGDVLAAWVSAVTGAPAVGIGLTAIFVPIRI
jgi:hypothetical protein